MNTENVSEPYRSASESLHKRARSTSEKTVSAYTKAERRISFARARVEGLSIRQAARAAGVSPGTGTSWERMRKTKGLIAEAVGAIVQREEAQGILTAIAQHPETPPAVKIAALAERAKVDGWYAPTRSQVEVRQVPATVIAWLDSLDDDLAPTNKDTPMLSAEPTTARLSSDVRATPTLASACADMAGDEGDEGAGEPPK